MNTKTIFKALALAMMMPAMLLTSACSNQDDISNTSNITSKGYALPVTVNATRGGDATRATFDGSKLNFGEGDKLFVSGSATAAGSFAGELTWQSGGTFSGTIYTQNSYEGTADDLFTAASSVKATLLPNGYAAKGSNSFLYVDDNNTTDIAYDDAAYARTGKAFVASGTAKATGVEQLSLEQASTYNSGFALAPQCAILNFTISGLAAGAKAVELYVTNPMVGDYNVTGSVTPNGSGVATFAIGVPFGANIKVMSNNLTIGSSNLTLPSSTTFTAGKIYNITRSAATDLSTINSNYTASNGETLTGTLANNVQISIADGATVTLNNVTINGEDNSDYMWAGITCEGDATIILSGTNTVTGFYGYNPGIYVYGDSDDPSNNKTLTIKGSGSLTASSNGNGAGIGSANGFACGNIEIQGGTVTATGGSQAAGIGAGYNATCGNITISGGSVTATGGSAAAGIGSGRRGYGPNGSSCGAIKISGGTVTARGGSQAAGIGSGCGGASCGAITISGGNVTAIAGTDAWDEVAAAIGKSSDGTCTSVTFTPAITSLTLTNSESTGIVSNFINATAVNANETPITTMLSTSVTDATITGGMTSAGFATSYNDGAKTWTITKQ